MHYTLKIWIQNDCDTCRKVCSKVRCNSITAVVHCDGQYSQRDQSTISSLQTHLESTPVKSEECLLSATISQLDPWLQNLNAHVHKHAHVHTHMCATHIHTFATNTEQPDWENYIPDHTRAHKNAHTHTPTHACTHTHTKYTHTKHTHTHTYTHTHTHTCTLTHTHIVGRCCHLSIHTKKHTYVWMYVCVYIYIYIYIYLHIDWWLLLLLETVI